MLGKKPTASAQRGGTKEGEKPESDKSVTGRNLFVSKNTKFLERAVKEYPMGGRT